MIRTFIDKTPDAVRSPESQGGNFQKVERISYRVRLNYAVSADCSICVTGRWRVRCRRMPCFPATAWGAAVLSGAMTDDTDAPPAAAAAVPEADKGWSEQDSRTLIITICGTLAANLATVILVAAAIAFVRWGRSPASNLFGLASPFFPHPCSLLVSA